MKAALIYVAFYAVIGVGIYVTQSALPLFALLLAPEVSEETNS
jgi:hypothetical protein